MLHKTVIFKGSTDANRQKIQKIDATQKTLIEALGWVIVEYDNVATEDVRRDAKHKQHIISLENKVKQLVN